MKLKAGQIALIGIPVVIGVYLIIKQLGGKKRQTPYTPVEPDLSGGGGSGNGGVTGDDSFPLKKGSKGNNVIRLQNALKKLNSSALPRYGVDGDFGNETESALLAQTGKTTCSSSELATLELLAAKKTGTWHYPMVDPNPPAPTPFGFPTPSGF